MVEDDYTAPLRASLREWCEFAIRARRLSRAAALALRRLLNPDA